METLNIIKTAEGVRSLIEYLADKDLVAFDTETTGVTNAAEIIGLSLCAEPGVGHYVITAAWNTAEQKLDYLETKELMPDLMRALQGKRLIMHNGLFDCNMVANNYKVSLIESLHTDTMILAHLLDENRRVGLKELGGAYYGDEAKKEQEEMKASVAANGGLLTRECYEMYKADSDLMARYGAKDAILTFNLFFELVDELYQEKLDGFFYQDESMPLLRGPTYELNTVGLKVDAEKLSELKRSLEIETLELKAFIEKEIYPEIKDKYPGTNKKNIFNIGSNQQLAWLLFERLGNTFPKLSDSGKVLCEALSLRNPYNKSDKSEFIETVREHLGRPCGPVKKVREYWTYLSLDKVVLTQFAKKYLWAEKLLEYKKLTKLLSTYVEGIQDRLQYGIIRPSFLQHGTTSGRYSSRAPNFQNLPREDKRVKSCIVARPGKVFVGADYSQLEPRVFAAVSGDETLMACFASGEDFYSVVGAPVFGISGCSMVKDDKNSFAKKYPQLRDKAKILALATPYGRSAFQQASTMGISVDESQALIDKYFAAYPKVELMMLESHEQAMSNGVVHNLYGRPRRIPAAKEIKATFGRMTHAEMPYTARTLLNLAMNHRVQSTGASIMNRAAIACWEMCREAAKIDPRWLQVKIVLQVHDELVLEGPEDLADDMVCVLKDAMENTTELPGVALIADPKVAKNLADLK